MHIFDSFVADCNLFPDLPGVEVVAGTTVMLTNSATTFDWADYGFKLTVPPDSLPAGVDQCRLDIAASTAGKYQFPKDFQQLVSGVFWIRPSVRSLFRQPLTIEIEHCAKMTSSTELSFVKAYCSQKSLPYMFKEVKGRGCFEWNSSYGSLELTEFSGIAAAGKNVEKCYTARVYYLERNTVHVGISWNTLTHLQVITIRVSTSTYSCMNVLLCTLVGCG